MASPPSIAALLATLGGALGGAASVATSAVTSVISGGASALSGAIGALGSVLSTGASIVSGAVGLLGGALGAIGGAITGAIGGILGTLTSAFSGLVSGIGDAIGAALKTGVAVIGGALAAAGATVFGFVKIVSTAISDFSQTAQQIASIRNNTGQSLGAAQTGYNSLRAAGMSGQGASSFLGSDMMRGGIGKEVAGAYGLSAPNSPHFSEDLASKAQGMNIFEKRSMADTLSGGKASPELLQMMNQKPADLRENQRFASSVNSSLGVTPETIRKVADEFPLLMSKVSLFVDAVKNRFVASMLPMISGGLDALTKYLEKNGENIASAIKSGVTWLYSDLPQLLINGASIGITALEAMANGFFSFGDAVADGLKAISAGQSGFFKVLESMAKGIDGFIEMLARGAATFAGIGAVIESGIATTPIAKMAAKAIGLDPQVRDPKKAYNDAYAMMPKSDIAGTLENFKNSGVTDKWAANVQGATDAGRARFKTVDDTLTGARDSVQKAVGTPEARRDSMEKYLEQIAANTKNAVEEAKRKNEEGKKYGNAILNGLKSNIAEEMFTDAF